jgi:ribulose-5-phosphate 4-epimerase/fuculose-1-phosphate aldolase
MVAVNLKGEVVGGNRSRPANAAGFLIHSEIHKARPDVTAICHAHTVYGKAWSVFGKPLDVRPALFPRPLLVHTNHFIQILTQDSCKFYKSHAVYNSYGGVVLAAEEGAMIAKALGPTNHSCILRNHGLLTVGQTVDEAAFLFTSLEHACQGQLLVEAAVRQGLEKVPISDEEAAYTRKMETDSETCYAEFQVYVDLEDHLTNGAFRK